MTTTMVKQQQQQRKRPQNEAEDGNSTQLQKRGRKSTSSASPPADEEDKSAVDPLPKSAVLPLPKPMLHYASVNSMDKWLKRSDFYEPHYLGFLGEIVSGVYKNIARKYDNAFWEEFTVEFNRRIEVAIADADPPMGMDFEHFSVVEVVNAGLLLRKKYMDYEGINSQNVPNWNLLELCFKTCDRCSSLPKFPTSLRSNRSSASSRANFSSTSPEVSIFSTIQNMYLHEGLSILDVEKAGQYINNNDFRSRFFLSLRTNEEKMKYLKDLPTNNW